MNTKELGSYAARPDYWVDVPESQWENWHWQIANRVTSLDVLEQIIELSDEEKEVVANSLNSLRMAITPYYASLMNAEDPHCPVRVRAVPTIFESKIAEEDLLDALHEDIDSPAPGITHRYPDRVLFLITDQCSMYCRHCTRRRYAGELDQPRTQNQIDESIAYVRETKSVRDVLLSGGDAFTLGTERLEYIIAKLSEIPHVDIIRYGTATPIVLPQRINDDLVNMLKKYQPVWINVHYNHPKELTARSRQALAKLADAGFALGNQSVLMRGVNDCPYIMKELVQQLVKNRVRPYRLYQCDLSRGISHFRTTIARGLEIMEHLVGHTTGFAAPIYTVDLPGGGGKVPVNPSYMIGQSDRVVIFRNYEGVIAKYVEPEDGSFLGCPASCTICDDREARGLDQPKVGLEKLFTDKDTISLEPVGLERNRRKEHKQN